MTGLISDDLATMLGVKPIVNLWVLFPEGRGLARAVRCMVSRRIPHFSVAESLGCVPGHRTLSKASANCDMKFGCDILLTSIRVSPVS